MAETLPPSPPPHKKPQRFGFTVDKLAAVKCAPSGRPDRSGRVYVYDEKVPKLAYCVTEGGSRSFYVYRKVKGRPQRVLLGGAEEMTIEQARRRAAVVNNQVIAGADPIQEKREARAAGTILLDLWASYRDGHLVHKRDSTRAEFERIWASYLEKWGGRRNIAEITSADVETFKARVGDEHGNYSANRSLALLGAMYRARGYLFGLPRGLSPTLGVRRLPEKARDRVLSAEEVAKVRDAIMAEPGDTVRDYFLMLLYTGARRANVLAMKWDDVSKQRRTWMIPADDAKAGKAIVVPLIPEAMKMLEERGKRVPDDCPFVFPARQITAEQIRQVHALRKAEKSTRAIALAAGLAQTSVVRILARGEAAGPEEIKPLSSVGKAWVRIVKRAGLKQRTTIHDIRRTVCTNLLEAGAALPHVSAAMGHRSMVTTQKHYAMARDKQVSEAMNKGVAGMLAAADEAAGEAKRTEQAKGGAA